jgi:hypothetical protein
MVADLHRGARWASEDSSGVCRLVLSILFAIWFGFSLKLGSVSCYVDSSVICFSSRNLHMVVFLHFLLTSDEKWKMELILLSHALYNPSTWSPIYTWGLRWASENSFGVCRVVLRSSFWYNLIHFLLEARTNFFVCDSSVIWFWSRNLHMAVFFHVLVVYFLRCDEEWKMELMWLKNNGVNVVVLLSINNVLL